MNNKDNLILFPKVQSVIIPKRKPGRFLFWLAFKIQNIHYARAEAIASENINLDPVTKTTGTVLVIIHKKDGSTEIQSQKMNSDYNSPISLIKTGPKK